MDLTHGIPTIRNHWWAGHSNWGWDETYLDWALTATTSNNNAPTPPPHIVRNHISHSPVYVSLFVTQVTGVRPLSQCHTLPGHNLGRQATMSPHILTNCLLAQETARRIILDLNPKLILKNIKCEDCDQTFASCVVQSDWSLKQCNKPCISNTSFRKCFIQF